MTKLITIALLLSCTALADTPSKYEAYNEQNVAYNIVRFETIEAICYVRIDGGAHGKPGSISCFPKKKKQQTDACSPRL